MTGHEFAVVEMMDKYGGSFVKALAEAFRRSDHINFGKLKGVFPYLWSQYEDLAQKELQKIIDKESSIPNPPRLEEVQNNHLKQLAIEHNKNVSEMIRIFVKQGADIKKIDTDRYLIKNIDKENNHER